MNATTFLVAITSEEPDALRTFYQDVLGLPLTEDMGFPTFQAGGGG